MSAYAFRERIGVSPTTAYGLVNNPSRIPSGVVLGAICREFKTQPNEILEWVPENLQQNADDLSDPRTTVLN